ncbi:MAG: hypothetical protein MJZ35_09370 [Bacteroidaceae bacterium]|nr:hypothetical protein [Bacteroidaceae bacterium]
MKKLMFILAILGGCLSLQSCFCAHDYYDYDGYYYRSRPRVVHTYRPAPPPPPSHRGHRY